MVSSLLARATGPQTNVTCASGFGWANDASGNSPCLVAAAVVGGCLNASELKLVHEMVPFTEILLSDYTVPVLVDGTHYNSPGEGTGNSTMLVNQCTW